MIKFVTKYESVSNKTEQSQIMPHRAQLHLRLGEVHELKIKFKKIDDYPVDLYYLMDLSNSMSDDKDKLSALGGELAKAMRKLTQNFRLGFGSFVDKVTMPFVSTVPAKLKSPCTNCTSPYSFKNHMPLNENTDLFSAEVKKAPVSGNLDSPEGGFDALMQAMVCTEDIGWRSNARRLLVFSTDASFHLAGDGRLAGIIQPNDCKCHMDSKKQEYTAALDYDYPSISQINDKAAENGITIIFAVKQNQESVYKELSDHIAGSSFGALTQKSENVIKLVQEQYEKLLDKVVMTDNASKAIEVLYYSKCLNNNSDLKPTDKCDGLRVTNEVEFVAKIKVVECPDKSVSEWKETIQFKPQGINETLDVELTVFCLCPCEQKGNKGYEENSESCTRNGTLKCGYCDCNNGRSGHKCECSEDDLSGKREDQCIDPATNSVCNGRGNCKCGVCNCFKRHNKEETIYGKFCNCDNFSCTRHEGQICNGPTRGHCSCGLCECLPGWSGPACESYVNPQGCIAPKDDKNCSGNGQCIGGRCKCFKSYSGDYCEECVLCANCNDKGNCVECQAYETGPFTDTCLHKCNYTIHKVDEVKESDKKDHEYFCQLIDDADCSFAFLYSENMGNVNITVQREKLCQENVNVLAVIFGVIGSTVVIGLLIILIWKLLTSIHDRREYAKFEKERENARFDRGDNPLYKGAVTKFDNPTFSGN